MNQTTINMNSKKCGLFGWLALACILVSGLQAVEELGRARFSWEKVTNPMVIGYKVHWGTASGVYTRIAVLSLWQAAPLPPAGLRGVIIP